MALITERYQDQIDSVLTCYDRILIQGCIPQWSYPEGMTRYLNSKGIRIFDYKSGFAQPLTMQVRENAERIAAENGIEIEYIRKVGAFRKDDRIEAIIEEKKITNGLVHIFSAMEGCHSYDPWHDKTSHQTFLKYSKGQCIHYYFYFIDPEYGLCYFRVPTWPPFRIQFYMNGHNLLEIKMKKGEMEYEKLMNSFSHIGDPEKAQKLAERIDPDGLHKALNAMAKRYCPAIPEEFGYSWTVMQIECATDIIFKKQEYLGPVYDQIIYNAIHTVKPDNIATFLGQKITWNFQKEAGTNFNRRILGTRIKHHMGDVSIKMYDKQGLVLRIECTCNNIGDFRVNREVLHRDGTTSVEKAPLKKSIYSLFRLFTIMKSANYRYLEFVSNFDDHSDGEKKLVEVTQSVLEDGRSFKGINFFETRDLSVLQTLGRGEFQTFGLRNKQLREHLPEIKPSAMTRILKRLRLHNLIEKIQHSSRYSITALGRQVITAGLAVRNLVIVPALTAT